MNEFDINTESWYIDGFAYSNDGGLDLKDMEWLCEYDSDSQTETGSVFEIEGYEELQEALEFTELENEELQDARDWCEQIVIARYMELMAEAHKHAKEQNLDWGNVPVYFTIHSYDFILKSGL